MENQLVGKTIAKVRPPTEEELEYTNEDIRTIIEFTDGSILFALRDEEGNGPGVMIAATDEDNQFYVFAE